MSRYPAPSTVQTLLFDASKWRPAHAQTWAMDHGYKASQIDQPADQLRVQQNASSAFREGTMRTIDLGQGIKAIVGTPKPKAAPTGGSFRGGFRNNGGTRQLYTVTWLPPEGGVRVWQRFGTSAAEVRSGTRQALTREYPGGGASIMKVEAAGETLAARRWGPKGNPAGDTLGIGDVLIVDKGSTTIGIHVRSKLHVTAVKEIDSRTIKVTFWVDGYRAPKGVRSLYVTSWKTLTRREFNLGKGDGVNKISVRRSK